MQVKNITVISAFTATLMSSLCIAEQGFYLGANIGTAEVDYSLSDAADLDDGGNFSNVDIDDSDTTFGLNAGYRVNPYFAVEVGYQDFGEYSISANSDGSGFFWFPGPVEATAEVTGIMLGVKGIFPVQENFEVYGKAGMNRWDADYDYTDTCCTVSESDDGTDAYFGIGATYILNKVGLSAGYTRFDVADTDLDVFALSVEVNLAQ